MLYIYPPGATYLRTSIVHSTSSKYYSRQVTAVYTSGSVYVLYILATTAGLRFE